MPQRIATSSPSPGPAEPAASFYYADGKKIPLTPSDRFFALDTGSAGLLAADSLAPLLSEAGIEGTVLGIPEYDLIVVASGPNGFPGGSEAAVEALENLGGPASPSLTGPTVYEAAATAAPGGAGLIPVGEILVRFMPSVDESTRQQRLDEDGLTVQQRQLLNKYELTVQKKDYPAPGTYLVAFTDTGDTITTANSLHEEAYVEHAQPNFVRLNPQLFETASAIGAGVPHAVSFGGSVVLSSATPPTDPQYPSQWGLSKIEILGAFSHTMGSSSISIAVIDQGCDLGHEDIAYKLPGYDAYHGDDNPTPASSNMHGTACAGIIAAKANNGKGGVGVAPNCLVLPIRIGESLGSLWFSTDAQQADGIRTAVDRGADVLSCSWRNDPSTEVTNAFKYAQTDGRGGLGCVIAVATGNDDEKEISYPANQSLVIPGLLAVGASNESDQRKSKTSADGEDWWGSNYGPELDVVAPGVHIFTTVNMGAGGLSSDNYQSDFRGTSAATPFVAGLAALILSLDSSLTSSEVANIIRSTADDLGPPGRDEEFGFGRINCRCAIEAVLAS